MHVPFLDPMFDSPPNVHQLELPLFLLGIVLAVAGLVWLRRLMTIEPEARTFRATSRGRSPGRLALALLAAGLATGAFLAAIALARWVWR